MELNAKQQAALRLICDTFAPGDDGIPAASELGAPDLMAELAGRNPRASERKQLATLLSLWDTPAMSALSGMRGRRFSALSHPERERMLLSFGESRVPQKRALFQALKNAALATYYMSPDASPLWESIGYPGPLGPRADAPPPPLQPLRIEQDTTLDCDVLVVGSGAGGGTAAGVLSEAGLDVVVLEAGEYYDDADFDGGEFSGIDRLYAAGPGYTAEGQVALVAGSCLGGGTVVNYTTSFRTPDDVRAEWASHGVPQFSGDEYTASLDAVCERLGVNLDHGVASARDAIMERGLKALGWHVDAMPRNVKGCDMGIDCGRCGFGCRLGAKQSVTKTWLTDAAGRGARLVVGVKAREVLVQNGRATGVAAVSKTGHRLTVRARAVVAACGAIQTPALLRRSGLENRNIGKHLRLHPVTTVWSWFDEEVRGWEGGMQTRYSREHRDLDGNGYGVIYETGPMNPALVLQFTPWRDARTHLDRMRTLPNLHVTGVIVRDQGEGEVKVKRDGEPVPYYRVRGKDLEHMQAGIDGAAHIAEAAGATRIASGHQRDISYEPGKRGSREQFLAECNAAGYGPGQCPFGSFHIMGSARMGGSPETAATNPDGATWDVPNLVVADGSCFPTASGVNPMISIESIAHMNARRLAATLS
jgi:long-chain-alcohol oxidase